MTTRKKALSEFFTGVPEAEFREEIASCDEETLRSLHKQFQRRKIGGGTSAIIGVVAAIPTCGASAVGTVIGTRRVHNNKKRVSIIEQKLAQEGWKGHKTGWKDYALPVTMGIVGAGVGVGIDAAADMSSAGVSGGDSGLTPSGTETAGVEDVSTTETTTTDFTQEAGFVDASQAALPPPHSVPEVVPPPDIPVGSYMITQENGMTLAFDGIPVDPDYGQITDSGMYQIPIDPSDPTGGGILAAGVPQDAGAWGMNGEQALGGGTGGTEAQLYGEYYNTNLEQTSALTTAFEQPAPYTYDPLSVGWGNAVAGAGVVLAGHAAGAHAHHGLSALLQAGLEEGVKSGSKQAAKIAMKSIWKAYEEGTPLPKSGDGPDQIQLTREFYEEYNRIAQTEQWKQLLVYVEQRERRNAAVYRNDNGGMGLGFSARHRDCLAIVEAEGYDRKLNDPERLKFFIENADGYVVYVRAWIIEYLEKRV